MGRAPELESLKAKHRPKGRPPRIFEITPTTIESAAQRPALRHRFEAETSSEFSTPGNALPCIILHKYLKVMRPPLACLALVLSPIWLAAGPTLAALPGDPAFPPLPEAVFERVVAEFAAPPASISPNEPRERFETATPENIDRLLNMPAFSTLPRAAKERALQNAGRGRLLDFERPSDVLTWIETWFPEEISATRKAKDFSRTLGYGGIGPIRPREAVDTNGAAFFYLWHCMPFSVWQYASGNPYQRRSGDGGPFRRGVACANNADLDEVEATRKRRPGTSVVHLDKGPVYSFFGPHLSSDPLAIERRLTPILVGKFKRFLADRRCTGSGPDDCVVVLSLWSDLTPDDPDLAAAITTLDAEVFPASAPPADLDETRRRAAFLRVRLTSILFASAAWQPPALAETLDRINRLPASYAGSGAYASADSGSERMNPWTFAGQSFKHFPQLLGAVIDSLLRLPGAERCEALARWKIGDHTLPLAEMSLREQQLADGRTCVKPDWQGLAAKSTQGRIGDLLVSYVTENTDGMLRDEVLRQVTYDAQVCVPPGSIHPAVRALCERYVSLPPIAPTKTLTQTKETYTVLEMPITSDGKTFSHSLGEWLQQLFGERSPDILDRTRRKLEVTLPREHQDRPRLWRRGDGSHALLEIDSAYVLSIDAKDVVRIKIPRRFQERAEWERRPAKVTDLDGDGRPEMWWTDRGLNCNRKDSDLLRNLDCSPDAMLMGEVDGDTLTYFHRDQAASARDPAWYPAPPQVQKGRDAECNGILIYWLIHPRTITLVRGGGHDSESLGDGLVASACAPHPTQPGQAIVAQARRLPGPNDEGTTKVEVDVAVIDLAREEIVRKVRERFEEDAGTRFDTYSLRIDTGRYLLKPGVRAFGVRYGIGHGPRCAEGGSSDFLHLYVEEGARLRKVLSGLPMSEWSLIAGSPCGEGDVGIESIKRTIHLAPTSTAGWRDLVVKRHVTTDFTTKDEPPKVTKEKPSEEIFRMRDGRYQ